MTVKECMERITDESEDVDKVIKDLLQFSKEEITEYVLNDVGSHP